MSRPGGDFDDIHWLDDDPEPAAGPTAAPRLPWPRWFTVAVAVLAIAAAVAVVNTVRRNSPAVPAAAASSTPASPSRPAPSTSASKPSPSRSATTPARPAPVRTIRLGHPLLGVTAGWEVFGRGPGVLARIQPAAGVITLTTVPDLSSGGPVSLLTGPRQVLIQPWDNVPGYVVPDGRPPRRLPLAPDAGGRAYPGPKPGQVWVPLTREDHEAMVLATLDGKRLPGIRPVPGGTSSYQTQADGAGELLFPAIGGLYQARSDGLHRISTGTLLAAGRTGWLTVECDERYRCQEVLVGREDGTRRIVPTSAANQDQSGELSPDGTMAAMMVGGPNVAATVYLVDLATGSRRKVDVAVTQDALEGPIAFSPDGKWLFVVTDNGGLSAIDCRDGAVSTVDIGLATLTQLAVRPAPGR